MMIYRYSFGAGLRVADTEPNLVNPVSCPQKKNQRCGPKGQGTLLPPLPCTTQWGCASGGGISVGMAHFIGGLTLVLCGVKQRSHQAWTTVCSNTTLHLFQRQWSKNKIYCLFQYTLHPFQRQWSKNLMSINDGFSLKYHSEQKKKKKNNP